MYEAWSHLQHSLCSIKRFQFLSISTWTFFQYVIDFISHPIYYHAEFYKLRSNDSSNVCFLSVVTLSCLNSCMYHIWKMKNVVHLMNLPWTNIFGILKWKVKGKKHNKHIRILMLKQIFSECIKRIQSTFQKSLLYCWYLIYLIHKQNRIL